ncbi:hypothetical protein [Nodosilinea sp. FACHB-13]|uniref:hypothetical protein n=1 Tax=Cyanophyceae TaxID=3028117 RepID=UPI0016823AC8|nr:hypothetical protein [Nodosilinea sp. FACHB-13]MBD2110057.1 hypothetical protein [Nodosilinea sp. FACHB-13]
MFNFQAFTTALQLDNPTYERVKRSDLHDLVALMSSGNFTAPQVAAEMKRISGDKWKKYACTRAYLIAEVPSLAALVKASLVNFRTQTLTALPGGHIKHDAIWDSDSGNLQNLDHIFVRERVSWGAASLQAINYLDPAYRNPGQHFGVGNAVTSSGSAGNMSDTHDVKGAWSPTIFDFAGPEKVSYLCSQVYQYSDDNRATWHDIPNSTYEILRTVSVERGKIKLEILKQSVSPSNRHENLSNSLLL